VFSFLSSEINLLKSKLNGLIITLNAQKKAAESGNLKKLEELLREERQKMVPLQ
jgi:hypothetical protein